MAVLSHSIFMEPWWLDIVAPGHWHEVVVEKKGKIIARMPYVLKKNFGIRAITTAPLTPHLGPYWEPIKSKSSRRIGREKDLIFALVDQLPPVPIIRIPCHPDFANIQPFYWKGFDLSLRYTYRIEDLTDEGKIWEGFNDNIRGHIRKAEKLLEIREDLGIEKFYNINRMTFERQGHRIPYSYELVVRLDEVLSKKNQRKIFFAVDSDGRVHAANYLVWDKYSAYDLMRGADPELRNSGAQTLLTWHAMKFASAVTLKYDFEGSMIEPVERFFRAFGGQQTPCYIVEKISPLLKFAMAAKNLLKK